jgi:hypothetical protein
LRQNPKQARAALSAYRRAAKKQKDVPELMTRLSRACHLVATYVEQGPERSEFLYGEGALAAEAALQLHPGFHEMLQESGDEIEAVREVDGPYLESAFWYAANLGRLANMDGARARIGNRDRLEAFIQRVLSRNDTLYYGGAHRFLGVMYLVLPTPIPDSARRHFENALTVSPLFLGTRTLKAENQAVREKNTAVFPEQLEAVLRMPPETMPEAAAENRYEQQRARALLQSEAKLF